MEHWYTLYTKPHAEYRVNIALQQWGLQTYLPEIESKEKDKKGKSVPFFPCYLFSKFDFEIIALSQLHWTPGLRRVVSFGGQPVPVPDELIDLIQYKLDEIETKGNLPTPIFAPGDVVRITNGPFCNMLAIFDGPTTPSERVRVLLDILGHASRVQVNISDLEKVPPETEASPLSNLSAGLRTGRSRRTRGRGRYIQNR
jgi:transcriptional antiterminator RfaH